MLQEKTTVTTVPVAGLKQRAWAAARGAWLGPAAWLLAMLGFALLGSTPTWYPGLALILFACFLAILAHRSLPGDFPAPSTRVLALPAAKRRLVAFGGVAASLALFCASNAYFLSDRTTTFGPASWLWLSSIVLFIASCLALRRESAEAESALVERWPAWELALFAGIVLLAVILRLWDLNNYPFIIMGDERTTGRISIDYYITGRSPSIFTLLWTNINLPGLWFWTIAQSLQAGGLALWALRLPAALFGAATAVPFYGFVRLAWGRTAAIVGTSILAFSAVDVHFSRITLNNIVTPFFWTVCFFFLLRGLRFNRPVDWAAAGLAGGLSEYGYYGTRLLPFLLLGFFAYLVVINRSLVRHYAGALLLVLLGYVVGFGPLLGQYAKNPDLYTGRGGALTWVHLPANWDDFRRMWDMFWSLTGDNLLGITNQTSQDAVYYAPLLLLPEAALLAIGVAVLIYHWRRPAAFLMVLTAVSVLFVGGTLVSYGAVPFVSHWTPAFPAFYAAIALPVAAWLERVRALANGPIRRFAPVAVAAGLALLCFMNVSFYFRDYHADPTLFKLDYYREAVAGLELQSAQAHYQAELSARYAVRIFGTERNLNNPNLPYVVQGQDYRALASPDNEPLSAETGKGLAFIFLPGGEQYREQISKQYPGGQAGEVKSPDGRHLFYTYVLEPAGGR